MYKLIISYIFFLLSFKKCSNVVNQEPNSNGDEIIQREILIALETGIFKLELKSVLIEDTLSGEWRAEQFGTPIVKSQRLLFYKNGKEFKSHSFPIGQVSKSTKKERRIEVAAFPILDICLINADKGNQLYYVYGANFCNGVDCPEFTGLYDMNGNILYEGISTNKPAINKLAAILRKYKLNLNKTYACKTILDIWKK